LFVLLIYFSTYTFNHSGGCALAVDQARNHGGQPDNSSQKCLKLFLDFWLFCATTTTYNHFASLQKISAGCLGAGVHRPYFYIYGRQHFAVSFSLQLVATFHCFRFKIFLMVLFDASSDAVF